MDKLGGTGALDLPRSYNPPPSLPLRTDQFGGREERGREGGMESKKEKVQLIQRLETLKGDGKLKQVDPPAQTREISFPIGEAKSDTALEVENKGIDENERLEIVKELKKIKRQNFITHCLVSAMIVLTVAWQLSEVSLVLKVKDGLSHPFRSFGSVLTGMLKDSKLNLQNEKKQNSTKQQQDEGPSESPFKIPEMPHLNLGLDNDDD